MSPLLRARYARKDNYLKPEAVMKLITECVECQQHHDAIVWAEEEGNGIFSNMWECMVWDAMGHWYRDHKDPLDKAVRV